MLDVDDLASRGRISMRNRIDRARGKTWVVGQCAVAAAVAWWLASDVLDHPQPFFAPIAAVVSLGTSYGQRLRRVAEVTVGVALGILMGDLFIHLIGPGAWQLVVVVAVGMLVALLLDAGALLVTQAAVQGIVVVTLLPAQGDAFLRWTDALVGGAVALVAATVVPRAPLRRPREQAARVARTIGDLLRAASECLEDGDVARAMTVLGEARGTETLIRELQAASGEGLSVVQSSPFRRRHGEPLRRLAELVDPLDFALRNTRVLVRRVAVAAHRREEVPRSYAVLVRDLSDVVHQVADELAQGRQASSALDRLVAIGRATTDLERTQRLTAEVILSQVRSIVADLLAVSGMDRLDATDMLPPI